MYGLTVLEGWSVWDPMSSSLLGSIAELEGYGISRPITSIDWSVIFPDILNLICLLILSERVGLLEVPCMVEARSCSTGERW